MSWLVTARQIDAGDADAIRYLAAVETADGQALEPAVRLAVDAFVRDCKADGIWNAIKASCILAGARTLAGALVPLVGSAPTNVGPFVSDDYNRKTGLKSNGTTKRVATNRNNNADPQNDKHLSVYRTEAPTDTSIRTEIGSSVGTGSSCLLWTGTTRFHRINAGSGTVSDTTNPVGLWGASRSSSSTIAYRIGQTPATISPTSETPASGDISLFARGVTQFSDSRIAFYSIGEALDLALLDARVTTLINAFDAAI